MGNNPYITITIAMILVNYAEWYLYIINAINVFIAKYYIYDYKLIHLNEVFYFLRKKQLYRNQDNFQVKHVYENYDHV